jgi:hypothetical protein
VKKFLIIFSVLIVLLALPFLGGSAIWYLNGANNLDIDGIAELVQRPESSIDMGAQWSHYGSDAGGYSQLGTQLADHVIAYALPEE